jgi:hypothetical protein
MLVPIVHLLKSLRLGNTLIRGIYQPVVNNEEEALHLLFEGESNRAIAEHNLNKSSSRFVPVRTFLFLSIFLLRC